MRTIPAKANETFRGFTGETAGITENRIRICMATGDAVQSYNVKVRSFLYEYFANVRVQNKKRFQLKQVQEKTSKILKPPCFHSFAKELAHFFFWKKNKSSLPPFFGAANEWRSEVLLLNALCGECHRCRAIELFGKLNVIKQSSAMYWYMWL